MSTTNPDMNHLSLDHRNLTASDFLEALGSAIMNGLGDGDPGGAYGPAFDRPAIRAYYVFMWALTLFVGTPLLYSVVKVLAVQM